MSNNVLRKVLVVEASPNGELSQSKKGTRLVIDALKKRYSNLEIKTRDLQANPVPHLKPELIQPCLLKKTCAPLIWWKH